MQWLMAMVGALLGLALGGGGKALLGLGLGAALGWQWARMAELRQRLDELEKDWMRRRVQIARPEPQPAPLVEPDAPEAATPTKPDVVPTTVVAPASTQSEPSHQEPVSVDAVEPLQPAIPEPARRPAPATVAARVETVYEPAEPDEPNAIERILARLRQALFSGNVPVKVGLLVLLFGVAAALKYAVDAGWLHAPISLRLAMVAAAGLGIILWGWNNRGVRPAFGLSLQGGGIGILLLTIFAAYRLYHLLPAGIAFALVLVLVAGAAALAVLQDSMALAVLGFLGGYLAPVLLSTGSGSHIALFSFYAVLNLAVFAIAWLRHWRALNLVGFIFTFGVGLAWGAQYNRPEHFATVEPFLIGFFLFYVAIVVLHAWRAPESRRGFVDGTLLFGTPLLAFGLQAAMLYPQPMELAFSAMAVALLYMVLAYGLIRRYPLLGQGFGVLAFGFATLAIPLAFSARATSTVWALEGAALVWLGLRQQRFLPQLTGIILNGLAALAWLIHVVDGGWRAGPDEWIVLNGHALSVLLLAISAYAISWLFERAGKNRWLVWPGFVVGTFWWFWAGFREIEQNVSPALLHQTTVFNVAGWVGFAAVTLAVMAVARRAMHWSRPGWNVVLVLVLSLALASVSNTPTASALHWPGAGFWLAWLVAALFALASVRDPRQRGLAVAHIAFLATVSLACGLALERGAGLANLGQDWRFLAAVLPLVIMLLTTWRKPTWGAFPLAQEFAGHAQVWFALAGLVMVLAWIQALSLSGETAPLAYWPVLNPAELAQLLGLVAVLRRVRTDANASWRPLLAVAAFVWLSFVGLRAVHHYAQLPWSPLLLDHGAAQATLTVLWAGVGVVSWVLGSRRRIWGLWLVGAIIMGVVLAKLILVDRQYMGNLAGIVSFMAVGLLLVLVGRLAPTPPRKDSSAQENAS